MREMFDLITKEGLTPNQFYLLFCMQSKVQSVGINIHQELRALEIEGWITAKRELSEKAVSLLQDIESYFTKSKKKTNRVILGEDAKSNIDTYNNMFPTKKLPSGKYGRSAINNLESAFKWFFQNHNYPWKTVLEATVMYINEYEKKNYLYMQTSQYFIRKQQADKSWGSELANWCAAVENGDTDDEEYFFKEKVL